MLQSFTKNSFSYDDSPNFEFGCYIIGCSHFDPRKRSSCCTCKNLRISVSNREGAAYFFGSLAMSKLMSFFEVGRNAVKKIESSLIVL